MTDASADVFQRFAVAASAIGASTEQVARFVTGLRASAIVSGASAQERSAAPRFSSPGR